MAVLGAACCLLSSPLIFQDVHDGDRKIVYENSSSIRIEPFGSNESWTVTAPLNFTTCTAPHVLRGRCLERLAALRHL